MYAPSRPHRLWESVGWVAHLPQTRTVLKAFVVTAVKIVHVYLQPFSLFLLDLLQVDLRPALSTPLAVLV